MGLPKLLWTICSSVNINSIYKPQAAILDIPIGNRLYVFIPELDSVPVLSWTLYKIWFDRLTTNGNGFFIRSS